VGAAALVVAALLGLCAGPAAAAPPAGEEREPCAHRDPQRRVFFGDLHVHTVFSQDASTQGTRATPRDAYRFARGEPLGIPPFRGGKALRTLQLERPLDFAAVTDHAELLGEAHICRTPDLAGHDSWVCRLYRGRPRLAFFVMNLKHSLAEPVRFGFCGEGGRGCLEAARTPWREIRDAAEAAYDRSSACRFTTFVGYEWTASARTRNLHRNVIFANERVQELPTSVYEAEHAEDLWRALRRECLERGDGCDAIAIPHNSNLSDGLMFRTVDAGGRPIDAARAAERAAIERLVEVMQHKGDSECTPADSSDELCGFEKLSIANFMQNYLPFLAAPPDPASFARRALQEGLLVEEALGVNPFQFGLVASTDTHLGAAGFVREDAHPGHGGAGTPQTGLPRGLPDHVEYGPGGLVAAWAEENTREAIFAALRRREVYGTSGPRLVVRFFGGWDLRPDLCDGPDFAGRADRGGVPMGGELPPPERAAGAPGFALFALRDPGTEGRPGAPLQRAQIVKGWVEGGRAFERVYDVAGDPGNGADVDLERCEPRGAGADALCTVWRDPDFEPGERAFYYARVLENPTCRWSQYVCNAHAVDCGRAGDLPEELAPCCDPARPRTIQERAWTSPIWYRPEAP
jgi:hypothetical protein